uniref:Uncharacterized protein n=1 Tax=Spongospora subterranea TaxID=70186 RepID=A0A0H5QWM8_9EUKA|eukprot:CRZ06157.1 hypothetical protein [Spongospora subterranea]
MIVPDYSIGHYFGNDGIARYFPIQISLTFTIPHETKPLLFFLKFLWNTRRIHCNEYSIIIRTSHIPIASSCFSYPTVPAMNGNNMTTVLIITNEGLKSRAVRTTVFDNHKTGYVFVYFDHFFVFRLCVLLLSSFDGCSRCNLLFIRVATSNRQSNPVVLPVKTFASILCQMGNSDLSDGHPFFTRLFCWQGEH